MFLEVKSANYIDGFRIQLEFSTGENLCVDLENELNGSVFEPLRSLEAFKKFEIVYNTIEWENGADFAPEYLYDLAKYQSQIASEPTKIGL